LAFLPGSAVFQTWFGFFSQKMSGNPDTQRVSC